MTMRMKARDVSASTIYSTIYTDRYVSTLYILTTLRLVYIHNEYVDTIYTETSIYREIGVESVYIQRDEYRQNRRI